MNEQEALAALHRAIIKHLRLAAQKEVQLMPAEGDPEHKIAEAINNLIDAKIRAAHSASESHE